MVTPFQATCNSDKGLDYEKFAQAKNLTPISDFVKGKLSGDHKWVRRGVYFAEQGGLTQLLQEGRPFYVSLSKSPQAQALHLGHMVTFEMARFIQSKFGAPVVIQISDDERYVYTSENDLEKIAKNIKNTIKDVLAFGFDLERTFVFCNTEYIDVLYRNVCHIEKFTTQRTVREAFEFTESDSIGMFSMPALRAAGMFSSTFPKVIDKEMQALVLSAPDQLAFNQVA